MSRLVRAWVVVKPIAMETQSGSYCAWNPDGQSFILSWGRSIRGRLILLERLRQQVMAEANELVKSLTDLLPYVDFSTFSLSQIADDAGAPLSLFDRVDNKSVFAPFIQQIWIHLGREKVTPSDSVTMTTPVFSSSGAILQKKAEDWLTGPAHLLRLILAHFYRTVGIPPRGWQTSDLLYRPLGQYSRNFRLIRNGTSFIGNPKAKQKDRLMYDAFWALPPHLGATLIFYLGVIRPVEIEILALLGKPTQEHCHYIFVHNHAKSTESSYVFTTGTINEILSQGPLELAYESRVYRHVMESIFDYQLAQLHPDALNLVLQRAVGGQGQHTQSVRDAHYAKDDVAVGTGMPLSKRNGQFAVSQIFHAWYEFTRKDINWQSLANYCPSHIMIENKNLAFDTARRLVMQSYGIINGNASERAARVAKLVVSKPFLLGSEVCPWHYFLTLLTNSFQGLSDSGKWEVFGDEVLVGVSATLVYGNRQPPALSFPPLGGFDSERIAIALTLVRFFPVYCDDSLLTSCIDFGDIGGEWDWPICTICQPQLCRTHCHRPTYKGIRCPG
jgi:hypothetical protein